MAEQLNTAFKNFFSGLQDNRGDYDTTLAPDEELAYRKWVVLNQLFNKGVDPETFTGHDYDMRGFFRGLNYGDPRATTAIDPTDKQLHFTDTWKKPNHETFSNESIYSGGANTKNAGSWSGDVYNPPQVNSNLKLGDAK